MKSFSCVSAVKNPPAMQETWVWSSGQEDPLEKEMATHSRILAWRIPRTENTGGPWGWKRSRQDWGTKQQAWKKEVQVYKEEVNRMLYVGGYLCS